MGYLVWNHKAPWLHTEQLMAMFGPSPPSLSLIISYVICRVLR